MGALEAIDLIKKRFAETGNTAQIPMAKGGRAFSARISADGIYVDNLGAQPFLPWAVFTETIFLLESDNGRVKKGNAMQFRLGEPGLSADSLEGHIAHKVYQKELGDSVFRRITPIAGILIWAGICTSEPGELILLRQAR
jgi:hypothetical protein